jgi:hypothetical protein
MSTQNDKNDVTGNNQSSFAGTNTNKYGAPKPQDEQDNPINPQEAQNVIDGDQRLSGEEAEKARRKANEGGNQERSNQS